MTMADEQVTASAFDFNAEASVAGGTIQIKLTGTADMAVRPVLEEFLGRVHARAVAHHVKQAVLDVRQLAFMNSSCLMELASWIAKILELPPTERYRINVLSTAETHWQRRSFEALSRLSSELLTIES